MADQEGKKEPIKVTDRRAFNRQGERRQPAEEGSAPESEPFRTQTILGKGFELHHAAQPGAGQPPAAVEFNSFILSLASTAFIHLGEMEDPVTSKTELNLDGARQMIDLLDMLHAKTKGNLEPAEEEFLTGVLYELKMKFAEKASAR